MHMIVLLYGPYGHADAIPRVYLVVRLGESDRFRDVFGNRGRRHCITTHRWAAGVTERGRSGGRHEASTGGSLSLRCSHGSTENPHSPGHSRRLADEAHIAAVPRPEFATSCRLTRQQTSVSAGQRGELTSACPQLVAVAWLRCPSVYVRGGHDWATTRDGKRGGHDWATTRDGERGGQDWVTTRDGERGGHDWATTRDGERGGHDWATTRDRDREGARGRTGPGGDGGDTDGQKGWGGCGGLTGDRFTPGRRGCGRMAGDGVTSGLSRLLASLLLLQLSSGLSGFPLLVVCGAAEDTVLLSRVLGIWGCGWVMSLVKSA